MHHNSAGTSRRLSDGESGRRALTSGLAMHALDQPKIRRKSSNDVSDSREAVLRMSLGAITESDSLRHSPSSPFADNERKFDRVRR